MVTLVRPEIAPLGAETVVVAIEPDLDAYGDPVPGTGEPFDVPGSVTWPKGTSEDAFRAATTTEDRVFFLPVYETDLSQHATITWRGVTYNVDGFPLPWLDADGLFVGTQVNATRGSA